MPVSFVLHRYEELLVDSRFQGSPLRFHQLDLTLYPIDTPHLQYIEESILVQSKASNPPVPATIST